MTKNVVSKSYSLTTGSDGRRYSDPARAPSAGGSFTPNVGSASSTFDFQASGTADAFKKMYSGAPGGAITLVRSNAYNLGGNNSHKYQANDYRENRFQINNSSGSSPVAFPDWCRGWSDSESATNARLGKLGIRLDLLTKAKVYQSLYTNGIEVSNGGRGWSLIDCYTSSVQYPDTSRTNISHNILFHQRVCDPIAESFLGNNFKTHATAFDLTVGSLTYRVWHQTDSFAQIRSFYITPKSDGYPTDGSTPETWGPLTHTFDLKATLYALIAHANTSAYFSGGASAFYLAGIQPGFEPIKHNASLWCGFNECWIAVNDEEDGGEATPVGNLLSESIPTIGFNGTTNDDRGGEAIVPTRSMYWRSAGTPASLVSRLGTVRPSNKQKLVIVWECPTTYGYDHTLISQPGYNNVGSYVIETHSTDYGPTPTSGWTTQVTVSGNTLNGRAHVITSASDGSDFGMVRMRMTASDGSSGNTDCALKFWVLKAPASGRPDMVLIVGDSQTANGLPNYNNNGRSTDPIGKQVYAINGKYLHSIAAGWPGISANSLANANIATLRAWLDAYPGKYCCIMLGSNDANNASQFQADLQTIMTECTSRGITPICCTPPWSSDGGHTHMGTLAAVVDDAVTAVSGALMGADIYTLTNGQTTWLQGDGLHFTDAGYQQIETSIATRLGAVT